MRTSERKWWDIINEKLNTTYTAIKETLCESIQPKSYDVACGKQINKSENPCVYCNKQTLFSNCWECFCRMSDAILFARRHGSGCMVWSYEGEAVGVAGRRGFVVAHPSVMWITQMGRAPSNRNNYEVIQEGAVCKLYFDLEFLYKYNKGKNGVNMTQIFIRVVCYFLNKEFGVVSSEYDVLNLTSNTSEKYSCHLIFNIAKHAFGNNIYVGNFVIMICNKLRLWHSVETTEIDYLSFNELNSLFIKDKENTETLFVDEGVYTKNRNFRVYKSTKFGKKSPLVTAAENKFSPKLDSLSLFQNIDEEQQLFLDSLVTRVSEECNILTYGENAQKERKFNIPGEDNNKGEFEGFSSSPYQEIDEFINNQIGQGYIRCWYYYTAGEILIYEIAHYRYCHNIGREHKSNGIFFVVNLREAHYYQKCHDTDCFDFRSAAQPLPKNTMFWKHINDESDENFDDEGDLAILMAATQVEQFQKLAEMSDEELVVAATATNTVWDNLSLLSTPSSSQFNSQSSTQHYQINSQEIMEVGHVSSQTNTVWDTLSLLSTPNSSAFNSQSNNPLNSQEIDELTVFQENVEMESDEELA
ncbi:unnamed protein product, partial [Meganyctiphanes norvegica]